MIRCPQGKSSAITASAKAFRAFGVPLVYSLDRDDSIGVGKVDMSRVKP